MRRWCSKAFPNCDTWAPEGCPPNALPCPEAHCPLRLDLWLRSDAAREARERTYLGSLSADAELRGGGYDWRGTEVDA